MDPTNPNSDVGLTLRELVLEVRADIRAVKEDIVPRVALLEKKAIETEAVAKVLRENKKNTWTRRDIIIGFIFSTVALTVQVLALTGGVH